MAKSLKKRMCLVAYATRTRVREVVVAQLVARLLPTLEIL